MPVRLGIRQVFSNVKTLLRVTRIIAEMLFHPREFFCLSALFPQKAFDLPQGAHTPAKERKGVVAVLRHTVGILRRSGRGKMIHAGNIRRHKVA